MTRRTIFTVGGTVQAGGGRYIPRCADNELLALCREGAFAFVLTARQMGKSSLMVRTAQRLADEGTRSVIVDLTQIGVQIEADAWYFGLLTAVADSLDLDIDVFSWWTEHEHQGYTQRLTLFFKEVVLIETEGPVVVFIDEIDSTLSLPFTDDFFAAIRYVYNARSILPAFSRLSFVLIGVASPIDLINDPRRTPFNVGQEVDLGYFTVEEALPLAEGLALPRQESRDVIRQIMAWTGGHPYLTQRLCYVLADRIRKGEKRVDVDAAVAGTFLGDYAGQDTNLRFVHDMLTRRAADSLAVLSAYRQILLRRHIPDDKQSPVITHLKLSGVVGRKDGGLVVRNPIYAAVFSTRWVKEQWPEGWYRRVPPAVAGLVAAAFAAVILFGLFLLQTQKAHQAEVQGALQEALNARLSNQVRLSDSLRHETELAFGQLSQQIRAVDSMRAVQESVNLLLSQQVLVAESLNAQLSRQMLVSDSLRVVEAAANVQLSEQVEVTDSMRVLAEYRLTEANKAALETRTIALASKALRQLKLGNTDLAALLARQAFLFSRDGEGEFLDPVYDALLQSLNALASGGAAPAGGSEVFRHHAAGIRAVAYSPDGRWIASAGDDGLIMLSSTSSGTAEPLRGHSAAVRALAFSPDGSLLASGSDDQTVRLWRDVTTAPRPEVLGRHGGGVWALAFDAGGKYLASTGAESSVTVRDVEGRERDVTLGLTDPARIRAVAFSPDGSSLAVGSEDGQLHLWSWRDIAGAAATRDAGQGSWRDVAGTPATRDAGQGSWRDVAGAPATWDAGQGRLHSIAFHPSGDLLASGGDSPDVRLWHIQPSGSRPQLERALRGHEGPVNALAFNPDGSSLASGSSDFSVQVWNMSRPDRSPIILQHHSSWVHSLAFSPEGERLATGSNDRTVRVSDVRPGHLAAKICAAMPGRELLPDEWDQHIGGDLSYELAYEPCTSTAAKGGL